MPELLAPAGNLDKLRTALLYGADAVYLGGQSLNLRAGSAGFTRRELQEAVSLAAQRQVKVYYCLNSFPFEEDLKTLPAALEEAAECGVDAFIIADPGILRLAGRYAPSVEVHLSTQANTTNSQSVAFWADMGVKRVNLARELSAVHMHELRKAAPDTELEVFTHGAMCLALSGQCLLSAWLNNRPANQGRCTHPCRFDYRAKDCAAHRELGDAPECSLAGATLQVTERTRPEEDLWIAGQNESYAALWAPQELCLLPYLPWFIKNGFECLKIEGRMKGNAYVAHVVDAYSSALKELKRPQAERAPFDHWKYMAELLTVAVRPLGSGFFLPGRRRNFTQERQERPVMGDNTHNSPAGHPLLGRISAAQGAGSWRIEVLGHWQADSPAEIMLPGLRRPLLAVKDYELENHKGEKTLTLNSGLNGVLHTNAPGLEPGVFIRKP